jgi:hypothetical protein
MTLTPSVPTYHCTKVFETNYAVTKSWNKMGLAEKNHERMTSRCQFVEQKLILSSIFRWNQIYKWQIYDFGHTLVCYFVRPRYSTNWPCGGFVEQKLILNSSFRCDQIHVSHCHESGHTLLCYLSYA